jgi:hypothetical protein
VVRALLRGRCASPCRNGVVVKKSYTPRARLIGADDLSQILGIQPRGEGCRADEIAEHHAERAAFGSPIDDASVLGASVVPGGPGH